MNKFDMELTQKQAREYKRSTKKERSEIIDRYCGLTGVSRNVASKRFRKVVWNKNPRVLKKKLGKRRGRKPTYTSVHKNIIKMAWELSGEICGERLYPMLGEYIHELEMSGRFVLFGQDRLQEVRTVSEATLKRMIVEFPKTRTGKNKGNDSLYKQIPINAHFGSNAHNPGYIEIDYVEHNGGSSSGQFGITGCYVDVCLGWITRSAALGKSKEAVGLIHDANEERIYHEVFEYHPDNAKPILKLLLERRLNPKISQYAISRSRPYHKEDNGHVEQKNGDKVRKLVGYQRYDREDQMQLLNELYEIEDQISNYFVPSQKLKEKKVDGYGRVVSRKHQEAKTAYQRLVESNKISGEVKRKVEDIRKGLSLVELRKQSEKIQNELFKKTF